MLLVGKTMPRVFRGEADMLEEMRLSGLLDEFYRNGAGLRQATLWLTAIIKQLTDRSPHLRFLEVGAGTGSATKDIFETIKGDFDHYTFTDISASFFDDAKEHFAPWKDRMSFKTCNVELDPTGQDFTEGEYDVIIASQILHATSNLSESVRNLRRLLKPGGWLLIGECSSNGKLHCAGSVIFGILPGWWNGIGEGRVFSPFASTSQWHDVLRQNGFGGIETMNPPHSVDEFGVIAMAAQAVDERIAIMRTPLSSPANLDVNEVLIIGGKTEPVATVVDTLQQILGDLGARSFVYRTLEDMDDRIDCSGAAVISLTDVEQPVFQNMDPSRWQKFRKLFIGDKEVLWLTCGRLKSGFYNNMTVGFGRVALSEEAELRLQNIDIDNISQLNARMIAEAFVRFTNKKLKDGSSKDILHTVERELIIDERGCEMVPRLAHLHLLNDRLRSSRRIVTHQTDLQHQEVALETNPSGCFLRQLTRFDKAQNIYGTR
jgi:SAM-dependent methyltransferase